jgi:ribonucleotide reductase alpha subunit
MKENVLKILKERYFIDGEKTWSDLVNRVSKLYPPIKDDLIKMNFIFSSPTLMNANFNNKGGVQNGTLSSCFPMGIEDSMEGILDAIKEAGLVTKACGGVGYDFSNLRSSNEEINTLKRNSSGPIPFIKIFNAVLDGTRQGGRRKGAGMAQYAIYRKDILKFIEAKKDVNNQDFNRFNFSVRIPNWFYENLENTPDEPMIVQNVINDNWEELKDENGEIVTYKQLWDKVIEYAWYSAEPGIFNETIAWDQFSCKNKYNSVLANPCLKDDAELIVLVDNKIPVNRMLRDVKIGDKIWSKEGWAKVIDKFPTGRKEVFRYSTKRANFEATSNHEVMNNGVKVPVGESDGIDCLDTDYNTVGEVESINVKIDEKTSLGEHDVWDITVDNKSHTFWCQGFNISNCSEHISAPYSSCNLGSINLSNFVKNKKIDYEKLDITIERAIRALDSVIDQNYFVIKKIKEVTEDIRPIGLGIMGQHHALIKMGIPYASLEGANTLKSIIRYITQKAISISCDLSKEKSTYPCYDEKTYIEANKRFFTDNQELLEKVKKYGVRNSLTTNVPPSGTISYLSETSSGIEPIFALSFIRRIEKENNNFEEVYLSDPLFDDYLNKNYKDKKEKILKNVIKNNGSCQKCNILTEEEKLLFKVAGDMSAKEHLNVLGACAPEVTSAISKTINMPKNASKKDVGDVYLEAYKKGIIGVTVYRDGCRDGVLITDSSKKEDNKIVKTKAPKRPIELPAEMHHITLNKQKYYVAIGMYDNEPIEVFTGKNVDDDGETYIPKRIKEGVIVKKKKGTYVFINGDDVEYELHGFHTEDTAESLTRQISLALRHGTEIHFITEQLQKIKAGGLMSFSKVLARVLKKYIPENKESTSICPKCGEKMIYTEGCIKCPLPDCGYSKCS